MFSRKTWIFSIGVAVTISGCGLRDYEERMAYEQKRVQYIEKENELLGPPVSFAPRKPVKHPETADNKGDKKKKHTDQPPPTPNLFLRLPKVIESKGKEIAPESLVFQFRFVPPKYGKKQTAPVAFIAQGSQESFAKRVQTELRTAPDISAPEFKRGPERAETLLDGSKMVFETFVARDGDQKFTMFLYTGPGDHVAIIFGPAKSPDPEIQVTDDAVSYCLRSLAVGPRIAVARQGYHAP